MIALVHQEMTLVCLEVVMPMAQPSEVVEFGGTPLDNGNHMVDLQPVTDRAAGHHAVGIALDERPAYGCWNRSSGMGHSGHVDAVGHQHTEDRVLGQSSGGGHRNGSDPGYLADLARPEVPPHQCFVVHPNVDHGGR